MASAGLMHRRAAFSRPNATADAYGNVSTGWAAPFLTVWASLDDRPGREAMKAGRPEATATAVLRIRDSAAARAVDAACRVVIDGEIFAIRDVRPPQRSGVIEIAVERGAAG